MTSFQKINQVLEDSSRLILLPGDEEFNLILGTSVPPNWQQIAAKDPDSYAFVADANSGLMRAVTDVELEEYLYGGEYSERLQSIGEFVDEWD